MSTSLGSPHADLCRTHQLITFDVVGRRYGVPRESVVAVVPLDSVDISDQRSGTPQPRSETGRWRERTLSIVDPASDVPAASKPSRAGRVLIAVLQKDGGKIGIAADRLDAVVTYDLQQIQQTASDMKSPLGAVRTRVVDRAGQSIDYIDPTELPATSQ